MLWKIDQIKQFSYLQNAGEGQLNPVTIICLASTVTRPDDLQCPLSVNVVHEVYNDEAMHTSSRTFSKFRALFVDSSFPNPSNAFTVIPH
jgi:hypothetical protein